MDSANMKKISQTTVNKPKRVQSPKPELYAIRTSPLISRLPATIVTRNGHVMTTVYENKRVTSTTISTPFEPALYNYAEVYNSLPKSQQISYVRGRYVEIGVDVDSMEARKGAYPANNVLVQLARLPDTFLQHVENILVRIPMDRGECDATKTHKHVWSAKQYKETGTTESTINRTFPFTVDLVNVLRGCTSLKHLDVIFELPAPLVIDRYTSGTMFNVALPFYNLHECPDWSLRCGAPGLHPAPYVPQFLVRQLDGKYEACAKTDVERIRLARKLPTVRLSTAATVQNWTFSGPGQTGPRAVGLPSRESSTADLLAIESHHSVNETAASAEPSV